jgi:hypothetical protein
VEELARASAASDVRQAQQRRERLAVKYRLGYPADLVLALKAKYGPKTDRRAAIRLAGRALLELRGYGDGPGALRQAGEGRP